MSKGNNKKKVICIIIFLVIIFGGYYSIQCIRADQFIASGSYVKIIKEKPDDAECDSVLEESLLEENSELCDKKWFQIFIIEQDNILFHKFYRVSKDIVIPTMSDCPLENNKLYYIKLSGAKKINGIWIVDYEEFCTSEDWNQNDTSSKTNIQNEPETVVEFVTTPKETTIPEKKFTIYDVFEAIKKDYEDSENAAVYIDTSNKEIIILNYFSGSKNVADKCMVNNFSADAYEMWIDMKSLYKKLTATYRDMYLIENHITDYSISCYLLNDENHDSANVDGSFSYLMKVTNGYCTFDATD